MFYLKTLLFGCLFAGIASGSLSNKSKKLLIGDSALRGGSSDIDWRFFLAGGISAACSHGITTPIDVIKTKMQTDPDKYNHGIIKAASDIIGSEGIIFLLAGLGPTIVGYGIEGALKFGFYETLKHTFATLTKHEFVNFLLAGVVAGAVASIVLVRPLFIFLFYSNFFLNSALWKKRESKWLVIQVILKIISLLQF